MQDNRSENATGPWSGSWKGTGNYSMAFAAPVTIDTLVLDKHTISGPVTFQAATDANFTDIVYEETFTPAALHCLFPVDAEEIRQSIEAQYFRLIPTGENTIGYIFLGQMTTLTLDADEIKPISRWNMKRTDGTKERFSLLQFSQKGYTVNYSSFIVNADYVLLEEMIRYLKDNNDMPLYFASNVNYPGKCLRVTVDTDNIEITPLIDENAPEGKRLFSLSLPLIGV
jgi:hypothetical protein